MHTHGHCDGLSGIHIIDGNYSADVKLDGLNMAYIGSWPGPIHEGHGKMTYYIDYPHPIKLNKKLIMYFILSK